VTSTSHARAGTEAAGARVLELSRCALHVKNGEHEGQQLVIDGDLFRMGKSTDNDLVLTDDATVSREHCEILRAEDGYLLRDLGSTNGTLLDGNRVREAFLKQGAVITVGRTELEVRPYSERIDLSPSSESAFGEMFGSDPALREVFGVLERLAPTQATLLIGGETGTGKDLLARSVHARSGRGDGPFIVVDCGAVVGSLIESELFGHEKGAFTGASERRQGAFELASGGTLFLDEVGELPLELQPKLLRALETRRIRRVGGQTEIALDLRIVAATNRNLLMEVERGKFRRDLYFRLAVVPLHLPPLRERPGDIPGLARMLLDRVCRDVSPGQEVRLGLADSALSALCGHDWPGNVRELRNVLERAALMAHTAGQTEIVGVPMLGAMPGAAPAPHAEAPASQDAGAAGGLASEPAEFDTALTYGETRAKWEAEFEARYVRWLLATHEGNVSAAARAAGMDRKYLHKLAKRHGIR